MYNLRFLIIITVGTLKRTVFTRLQNLINTTAVLLYSFANSTKYHCFCKNARVRNLEWDGALMVIEHKM